MFVIKLKNSNSDNSIYKEEKTIWHLSNRQRFAISQCFVVIVILTSNYFDILLWCVKSCVAADVTINPTDKEWT